MPPFLMTSTRIIIFGQSSWVFSVRLASRLLQPIAFAVYPFRPFFRDDETTMLSLRLPIVVRCLIVV